jgi:Cupin domain
MWVVLKTYAADGENGLHAHPNEDHTFVVLQGEATFYGPNGESSTIGRNEGVLLPHGTFYWFKATSEEPLVMVRVGAAAFDGVDRHGRIAPDGSEMRGDSVENKQVELIMSDRSFRYVVSDADRHSGAWRQTPSAYLDTRPARGMIAPPRSLYLAMPDGCRRLSAARGAGPGAGDSDLHPVLPAVCA